MRIANYEYSEKIGQGAFGVVYKGKNELSGEYVVIKTEPYNVEFSSLKHESTILNLLYSKSCRNIPATYWYGIDPERLLRILVMPFYEESLEQFIIAKTQRGRAIPSQMANNIMIAAISVLDHVHSRFVVHRDIKPANWMIKNNELILIDFGLASFYTTADEKHIQPANPPNNHIIGTPKYVSLNIHLGKSYTRRDDLMSMAYVGLFLLRGDQFLGRLPVLDADADSVPKTACDHQINRFYQSQKILENVATLAEPWSALKQFAELVYSLAFQERPDYDKYIAVFEQMNPIKNDINTKNDKHT
jgi:serine/threonine protein kinase